MNKRLNIMLPEKTVELMDKVSKKGDRSKLINTAVLAYIDEKSREHLRQKLKERALTRFEFDRKLAEEWFPVSLDIDPV